MQNRRKYDSSEWHKYVEDEEKKRILKQAFDEWCESKFALFGKWSFYGIAAAAIGALGYFLFVHGGKI